MVVIAVLLPVTLSAWLQIESRAIPKTMQDTRDEVLALRQYTEDLKKAQIRDRVAVLEAQFYGGLRLMAWITGGMGTLTLAAIGFAVQYARQNRQQLREQVEVTVKLEFANFRATVMEDWREACDGKHAPIDKRLRRVEVDNAVEHKYAHDRIHEIANSAGITLKVLGRSMAEGG